MLFWVADGNETIPIHIEQVNGLFWIHLKGKTFTITPESLETEKKKSKLRPSGGAGGSGGEDLHPGEIISPMPGKVTKLFCQEGDIVKKGHSIVVLEAMKMEYTLKSDTSGVVHKIHCQEGQQVVLGQELVMIKAIEECDNDESSEKKSEEKKNKRGREGKEGQ